MQHPDLDIKRYFDARTDYEKAMVRLGTEPQVGERIIVKDGIRVWHHTTIASVDDDKVTVQIAGEKKPRSYDRLEWLAQTTRSSRIVLRDTLPPIDLTEDDIRMIGSLAMEDLHSDMMIYLTGETEPRRVCRECSHEIGDGTDEQHRNGCAAVARRKIYWKTAMWMQERSGDTARQRAHKISRAMTPSS